MPYDAIVVGGSFAGLSAATMLVRARRRVLVIDAGLPRNRFASHSHGVIGQDGRSGAEILTAAREQVAAYPTATLMRGLVIRAEKEAQGFTVVTEQESFAARRLLLASGIVDMLPDLPGLAERWGKSVLHCPYCHGYEIDGGAIGVLASSPISTHQALLIADWGQVTLFLNGQPEPDAETLAKLARRGVAIERRPVVAIEGAGEAIESIRLADGGTVAVRALFIAAPTRMASPLAAELGCAFDETPIGPIIRTNAQKETTVAGVYAAGDASRAPHNVTFASADGVAAGLGLHHALIAAEAEGQA